MSQISNLIGHDSTNAEAILPIIIKGITNAKVKVYETPTFFPHTLHVAGKADPINILRIFEIPG
jgi:hypothetical protein